VHEDVADKVDVAFRALGEQRLKGIDRAVLAFEVADDLAPAPPALPAPERPSKPSVAVLAFENHSPDGARDYFAEGIAEDITTALARVPWLFVIARNSAFSYRGIAADLRRIGRELGVRYVLEGSVRRAGDRLRVTGQLVDTETGMHVWADRFDGQMADVFALQDRITAAVVGAIAPEIRNAEIGRALLKRPESRDAYDHFLRALAAANRFRIGEADAALDAAIRLAPDYPIAKAVRAWLQTLVWHPDLKPDPGRAPRALALAEEVLAAPDADIEAAAYAGYVVAFFGEDFERGLAHVERAIELCPNCLSAWGSSCLLHAMRNRPALALERAGQALRLSPRDPMAYRIHAGLTIANVGLRDWEGVLACVERARVFENSVTSFRHFEIVALVHIGRVERARLLAQRFLAVNPGFTIGKFRALRRTVRALDFTVYEPVIEGMAAAGIPE
jgi:adenylate cyclase